MKMNKSERYTHFDNEIEGGYHNDRPDWFLWGASLFLIGFGLVGLLCLI